MIRLLLKSALISGAVYLPLYVCLQFAPALTAPLAVMMVGIAIGAAVREILVERRLRSLVRYSRLPFRLHHRPRKSIAERKREKEEALALAA